MYIYSEKWLFHSLRTLNWLIYWPPWAARWTQNVSYKPTLWAQSPPSFSLTLRKLWQKLFLPSPWKLVLWPLLFTPTFVISLKSTWKVLGLGSQIFRSTNSFPEHLLSFLRMTGALLPLDRIHHLCTIQATTSYTFQAAFSVRRGGVVEWRRNNGLWYRTRRIGNGNNGRGNHVAITVLIIEIFSIWSFVINCSLVLELLYVGII